MKILKKNLKLFIGILIGAILTGGIAYAAVSAGNISYTTNKNENIKNVSEALNDLYNKNNPKIVRREVSNYELWYGHNDGDKVIDVTSIPGYENLTVDNFVIKVNEYYVCGGFGSGDSSSGYVPMGIKKYENGQLTVNITGNKRGTCSTAMKVSVLAFYIDNE